MLIIPIITAGLLILSFPPFDFSYLIWFSLVSIFLYIGFKSIKPLKSFLIGFAGYAIGISFIFSGSIRNYGVFFYIYTILYHSILSGGIVATVFSLTKSKKTLIRFLVVCVSFVLIEYIKTLGIFSFPCSIDLTQTSNIFLLQITKFTGHYGIGLVIILINMILSEIFYLIVVKKTKINGILILISVLILIVITNFIPVYSDTKKSNPLTISILQTGLPISFYNSINKIEVFSIYEKQIKAVQADLLVIPEGLGKIIIENKQVDLLKNIASNKNMNILINIDDVNINYTQKYNSSALIESNGLLWQYYHKTKIIPIAEKEYHPGKKIQRLLSFMGYKIGINICFESLYPEIARRQVKRGADFIVIQANDAGFTGKIIPELHLRYSIFRACENGVWVIHASQAGPSAFISPDGKVISKTTLFEKTNLTETINIMKAQTFYNKYGDWLIYLSLVIVSIYGFNFFAKGRCQNPTFTFFCRETKENK